MKKLSRNEWIAVSAGVVFVSYAMFGQTITNTFKRSVPRDNSAAVQNSSNSGLKSDTRDIVIGSGALISPGMTVGVNYVLKLSDGTLIQDSKIVNNGAPITFIYASAQSIPPWEVGMAGMRVGGRRIITIPPELAYGPNAVGPIPGNSTLVFDVEVLSAE
jgi:FKBP-type peptidyl-prolyl cis-trans isomerase